MSARRRPWLQVAVTAVLGVLVLPLSGCGGGTDDPPEAAETGRLELSVEPRTGDAPLEVRLEARLLGAVAADGRCPSLAWDFGNGDVMIAQASGCRAESVPTAFGVTYTYPAAGAYEPFVRLLASDIAPSSAVQVLVRGATPTAAAVAALPGPTIIIATPMPSGPGPGEMPLAPPASTAAATAPPTAVPTTGAPPTAAPRAAPTQRMAAPVLPADLYYIDAGDGSLWRLDAAGRAPAPVTETGAAVQSYAVSTAGTIATTRGGRLTLTVPGGAPRTVAETAAAPVWSRDGRLLAYASDGVWVLDVAQERGRRLASSGTPLAFSTDGLQLAVRGADGAPVVLGVADGAPLRLPLPPVTAAGWLPDRPVAWLAGAGLHLATVDEPTTLGRLLEETALVVEAVVRSDLHLMALADRGEGLRAFEVDLTESVPAAAVAGPVLQIGPGAGYAWAPDGRTAAVADATGLSLLDTRTAALVRIVARPARDPQWVLAAR